MSAKRTDIPVNDVIRKYRSGWSKARIGNCYGGCYNVIRRILREQGVRTRTDSEVMKLRWQHATSKERRNLLEPMHKAVLGRKQTLQHLLKRAQGVERMRSNSSPAEFRLQKMLQRRRIQTTPQKAIGKYNCDLAAAPVAVEILGGYWYSQPTKLTRIAKRLHYILNLGWNVLMVLLPRSQMLSEQTADHVAAYIKKLRRNPPATCEYRVIWSTGKTFTTGSAKDDYTSFKLPGRR
jgi:very-short-patch-repair endonuclease